MTVVYVRLAGHDARTFTRHFASRHILDYSKPRVAVKYNVHVHMRSKLTSNQTDHTYRDYGNA
jgi:hypothetical protein